MTSIGPVLVTGADQHQGLAVIRGLGQAGIPVIAAGNSPASLGFASRYVRDRRVYTSPFADPGQCRLDLLAMIEETRPAVVIPSVEATLVLLNEVRAALPRGTILAAPSAAVLEFALDKERTLGLARECGVPVSRTAHGGTVPALLAEAASFRFPLVIKPRGHSLHASTANALGFKARYAASMAELRGVLEPFATDGKAILVQEYTPGAGRCVSAVCDRGRPLALFAYARDREVPLTGGVSVLRRSIPLDATLAHYTTSLLGTIGWHGVAMVEFKYDAATGRYTLMEINGRFQASTALSLDAGLNLPHLVAALYAGAPLPAIPPYRIGVEERWLRGDIAALIGAWASGSRRTEGVAGDVGGVRATVRFLRDFRPRMHYDEFKRGDWRPGLVELRELTLTAVRWVGYRWAGLVRRLTAPARMRSATRAPTQRSIRA